MSLFTSAAVGSRSGPTNPYGRFAERVHIVAPLLAILTLVGWSLWFHPYDDLLDRSGTPLGADFAMFHVAGEMLLDGEGGRLYEQTEHQRRLRVRFPGLNRDFALPFRYPPVVALLTAPLASLPYAYAFWIFFSASCASGILALCLLSRNLGILAGSWSQLATVAVAGWPVVLETLIGGQASLFALLALVAAVVLMRQRRWVPAGVVFGFAMLKPNLLFFVVLGCILVRPRLLLGFLPTVLALLAASIAISGWQECLDYAAMSLQLASSPWDLETPAWKVHSLAPWLNLLFGSHGRMAGIGGGLVATGIVAWRWRRCESARERESGRGDQRLDDSKAGRRGPPAGERLAMADHRGAACGMGLALLVTVNALANPYTPIYDLALLAVGVLVTADSLWRAGESAVRWVIPAQWLLGTIYFGPHLSQFAYRSVGVQVFPLALLLMGAGQAWYFDRLTRRSERLSQNSVRSDDGSTP